jgi:hypothetical protein
MDLNEIGRYWHVACPYFCENQVVIFGGAKHDPMVEEVQFCGLRDLTILTFGMTLWLSMGGDHGLVLCRCQVP